MGVTAMRIVITPAVLGLLSAMATVTLCAAELLPDTTPQPPRTISVRTVHLYGIADLEHLRETNFFHYLRAKKILAAANEICRPKPDKTFLARFDHADPKCGSMWMTSLPPKKQLIFHLDDVNYIALVTVTGYLGKVVPVQNRKR
jgi:hypothetical protein